MTIEIQQGETAGLDGARLRRALVQRLESLQRAGVMQLPKIRLAPTSAAVRPTSPTQPAPIPTAITAARPLSSSPTPLAESPPEMPKPAPKTASVKPVSPSPSKGSAAPAARPSPASAQSSDERQVALDVINAEVRLCTQCSELACSRTQTVFGVGNIQPRLCFFGEAPGADEDRQGEPFVGRAGQLLNDMISKGMGLRREDVYILNVLKCHPPNNRPPADDEIANCRHFFERQLAVLQPEFICCLGAVAAKALLQTTFSIGKLRGKFYEVGGAKVIATYHPAYLLRNPPAKKDVWEDLKLLLAEMGLPIPNRQSS